MKYTVSCNIIRRKLQSCEGGGGDPIVLPKKNLLYCYKTNKLSTAAELVKLQFCMFGASTPSISRLFNRICILSKNELRLAHLWVSLIKIHNSTVMSTLKKISIILACNIIYRFSLSHITLTSSRLLIYTTKDWKTPDLTPTELQYFLG